MQVQYKRIQPPLPGEIAYLARPPATLYLHEFVQPLSHDVYEIAKQIAEIEDENAAIEQAFMKAIATVEYELDEQQFGKPDWFQFPFEVLMTRRGDCEDTANLLTSILRAAGISAAMTAYGIVTIDGRQFRHAWTEVNYTVIETTIDDFVPVTRPPEYQPEVLVNDTTVYTVVTAVAWKQKSNPPPKLPKDLLQKLKERLKEWRKQLERR